MSSWGKADAYTSAPLWALMQVNKAPTLANMGPIDSAAVELLFENAEADDFITGLTVGLFNYGDTDIGTFQSSRTAPAHAGWNLKFTGSGGRTGRVYHETLVALTSVA
jgi:hypothetical protein